MQGGVGDVGGGGRGGGTGAPTAMNQLWVGPSLQKVENPRSKQTAHKTEHSFCMKTGSGESIYS